MVKTELDLKTESKKELMQFAFDIKLRTMKADFVNKTSIMSFRELINMDEISVSELKKLWADGKKQKV